MPSKKQVAELVQSTPRVAAVPIEATAPAVPMVRYRGSTLRGDGGWDVIDITVKPDATPEEVNQAVTTWHLVRQRSMEALRAANRRYTEEGITANPALILTFGKHVGRAIAELHTVDPGYLEWLAENARDEEVRVSALYVQRLATAAQRLAAVAVVQSAIEEARAQGVEIETEPPVEPGDKVPF